MPPCACIYVLCHDDQSEETARNVIREAELRDEHDAPASGGRSRDTWYRTLRLKPTPLLESAAFFAIVEERQHEWFNADYIGTVTYSIDAKRAANRLHPLRYGSIANAAKRAGKDVIGFCGVEFLKDNKHVSCLEGSVFQHGLHYYRAWTELLFRMGWTEKDALADVETFFCNWWLCTPACMRAYVAFLKGATEQVWGVHIARELFLPASSSSRHHDMNDFDVEPAASPLLRSLFYENAHYKGAMTAEQCARYFNVPYYSVTPFIFERLPSAFFRRLGVSVRVLPPRLLMLLKE